MAFWILGRKKLNDAQNGRRSLLNAEMERVGLASYDTYLSALNKAYDDGLTLGENVADIVSYHILDGYPSLHEVAKVLAPAVRRQMLLSKDCWVKNDARCQRFIEGDDVDYPDVDSLEALIQGERAERRSSLEDALLESGIRLHDVDRLGWSISKRCKNFIHNGTGDLPWILGQTAAEVRYQDLVDSFKGDIELLKGLRRPDDSTPENAKNGADFHSVYRKCHRAVDQELVAFVLQEGVSNEKAADVLASVKARRSVRQQIVDKRAAEFELDLHSLTKTYQHYDDLSKVKAFVEEGTGDGEYHITLIALDRKMKELGLSGCRELFREAPTYEQRFSEIAGGPKDLLHAFTQSLVEEKEARLTALRNAYSSQVGSATNALPENLEPEEESMLQQSLFSRFGSGSVTETVRACRESFRRKALNTAIQNVTPSLLSCDISSRMKEDNRLSEFIKGVGDFQSAESLANCLKKEETTRKDEINLKLSNYDLGLETVDDLLPGRLHLQRSGDALRKYIMFGDGCSNDIVHDIAKRAREDQLRKQCHSPFDYWKLEKVSLFQEFIEGRSGLSCQEVVSRVTQERETRQQQAQEVIRQRCKNEETALEAQRLFRCEIEKYVDGDIKDTAWIDDSVDYHFRLEETKACFGRLGNMLPRSSSTLECVKDKLQGKCLPAMNEIIHKLTGRTEAGVANEIVSFFGPTFYETLRFDFSRKHDLDLRIILFLTKSADCPWQTAEQAVREIRKERKDRMEQIDKYSEYFSKSDPYAWSTTLVSSSIPTPQEKEDAIWNEYGPRADFINGKCSLEDALETIFQEWRTKMLEQALSAASLHRRLITENQQCVDFVEDQAIEDATDSLKNLISSLQKERTERCRLLDEAFVRSGVKDLGIGTISITSILLDDDDMFDDPCICNPDSDFPWEDDVAHARFDFVDLGEGEPDDVVRTTIHYQRTEKLERAVDKAFGMRVLGCHAEEWIRKSKKCKTFVLDTRNGPASEEEVDSFVQQVLANLLSHRQTRSPGGSDSDDNSDYYDPYEETDGGNEDWKYHMSGGAYGDDPDQDATWDAYWDS